MARQIVAWTRITMDGVLQSPSGAGEDTRNGFKWGGWSRHYWDELMSNEFDKLISTEFDLLLGRWTYEVFKAYWPHQHGAVGKAMNRGNKYVVATTPIDLSWAKSILINKDVVNEVSKIKNQDGPDLLMFGSARLIQTLLSNHMVDILKVWTFPITLGQGQKLFEEGTRAQQWKLTDSMVSTTGAVFTSYALDGEVKLE